MDRDLKRSIILDNYQSPNNKHTSDDSYFKINTRNVSCIDNLDIYLKIEDNIIKDISFEGEATYNKIFEGDWKSNDNYAVIHRIAVDHELKGIGLSSEMIKQTELMCNKKSVGSIKVDTHEDNQAMQRSLIKNGFDYCGVIYLADGSKRVAFEKCL